MSVQIICPTHGRAGRVKAFDVFGRDLPLCVADSQAEAYAAAYPWATLIVHPDAVVGLSPKRQWLLERAEREGHDLFMVDDDVSQLLDMQRPAGQRARIADRQTAWDLAQRCCDIAEDMGCFLFGFNQGADPATFRPQRPVRLTGFIGGHALGIRRGSKLWFPLEGMHGSEDMWVSALNAYHHRFCFVDQRYCYLQGGTFTARGGQAGMRTMANLRHNFRELRETFGDAITQKKPTMRAKLSHDYQITLKVPW